MIYLFTRSEMASSNGFEEQKVWTNNLKEMALV
jgi:hypothetical protein